MPIIYPGIQVSLDTRQSDRCKGRSLCSFSGQSYLISLSKNKDQQDQEINELFIKKQDALLEKKDGDGQKASWDDRNAFFLSEYQELTLYEKLQLTKLHAARWNYGLILVEKVLGLDSASNQDVMDEKRFVEKLNSFNPQYSGPINVDEKLRLYAAWFFCLVESEKNHKISLKAAKLFKKEMGLDEHCDLSKEITIATTVNEFRRKLDALKLPINHSDLRKAAIDQYEAAAVTSFVNYQTGHIDQGSFIKELQAAENQCTKVL
ncbi:hypothetical protein PsalMR5_03696 [Piscirickettsia salmonis]|uniref:hypothetical protein n=1 Tax=Piscirickettsia salmonis TaxID=1238 RepID=UPI0012BA7BF6|nr:hypothetical protein [Piscirickettsia salmonis]QGP65784.1 hypothetical protein PsalMR5_03696 [Piscirickettsia salmonis]